MISLFFNIGEKDVTIFVSVLSTARQYLRAAWTSRALFVAKPVYFSPQGDIGLNAAHMTMELIKDNRKIVDRISKEQINHFVELLKKNKVHVQRSTE